MYQYRGYTIQLTDFSWMVRDNRGKYIVQTVSDKEAEEYIDDILDNEKPHIVDWYKRFEIYCKSIPSKIYIDGKIATTNEKVLRKFVDSFERQNNVSINITAKIISGEYFYIVTDVKE